MTEKAYREGTFPYGQMAAIDGSRQYLVRGRKSPPSPSYLITRAWTPGSYFDRLRYYPGGDGTSFVQEDGVARALADAGGNALQNQWFAVSPAADSLLRQVIAGSEGAEHDRPPDPRATSALRGAILAIPVIAASVAAVTRRSRSRVSAAS
ncbi:MAG TPA: hypothetical protein VFC51_09065 [Chloroflexota bacterium]|nr:hypothetical protein [Chloroflexota bacterium]